MVDQLDTIGKRCAVRTKPLARQRLRVLVGRGVLFDRCIHDAEGVFFWAMLHI
jgi:hypothetical protein